MTGGSGRSRPAGPPARPPEGTLADPHAAAGAGWMTGRTALVTGGGLSGPAGGVGYAISRLGIAKAGIENLTKGAASLLGPRGIRVNCIQLGEIWTAMAARGLPEGARARRRLGVALQTEGTCWDAAYAALFLASDRARWISGHILTMDGGGPYRTTMAGLPAADTAGPPEAGLATAVPR